LSPIETLYQAARELLRGYPPPIPLRLDLTAGQLVSALPRRLAAQGLALELPGLDSDRFFSRLEEQGGMLVFTISPRWYWQLLDHWARLPREPLPPLSGERRQDREDPVFLLAYTIRRCAFLASQRQRSLTDETLPRGLLLALAREETGQALALYWAMEPVLRRDSLLCAAIAGKLTSVLQKIHPSGL